jgi:hypothetical protein
VIRVPAENLEPFIADIEKSIGEVFIKEVTSRDVTEEFIDLETRLQNKKNYLNRYNELLKQARTIKEILEIQQKTRELEEEIESTTGRLKYLTSQVDYSTLRVQLSRKNEIYPDPDQGNFIKRLKWSVIKGWRGLVTFTLFIIRLWPFWILAGGGLYLIRKIIRRRKK